MRRSGAETARAGNGRRSRKLPERARIGMAEGKGEAYCDIAVAKRVGANRLGRPPTRRPRQLEEAIGNRAAKCRRAARGDDIPRTRVRLSLIHI